MSETQQFSFSLEQQDDFALPIRFDKDLPPLLTDESVPLGKGSRPHPPACWQPVWPMPVGQPVVCLAQIQEQPGPLVSRVTVHMVRNEDKRLRVGHMEVVIQIGSPALPSIRSKRSSPRSRILRGHAKCPQRDSPVAVMVLRHGWPYPEILSNNAGVRNWRFGSSDSLFADSQPKKCPKIIRLVGS